MPRIIKQREPLVVQLSSVHPLLSRIYSARSVVSADDLDCSASQLLSPQTLKGIDAGASLLADAVCEQKKVIIVADFDADGATSCALSILALRAMGLADVDFLVPNRFEYGYGLTPEIVEVAKEFKPDLIMTVDNGISSVDGVQLARDSQIDVLVTDHHLPGKTLPNANAIVNPNQPGCDFPSKNLAGVGVAFYVLSQVRAKLRQRDWFANQNITEPNLAQFLDIVALGTVADVVPLDANNRRLVHQGIQRIRKGVARPGILALLDVAKRSHHSVVAADLGFAVGPRLNAAGRLDDMSVGIRCLLTDDPFEAKEIAEELDGLNQDRRLIERGMQDEAEQVLLGMSLNEKEIPYGLCLYDGLWHQGVIGILASRIKDKFHRPVIAFANSANDENGDSGEVKGSARSVAGVHIRDVLDAIASQHSDILYKFGGHAMAAGLSLKREHLDQFKALFDIEVRKHLSAEDLTQVLWSDGELEPEDFNLATAGILRNGGPWGQLFPEPAFNGVFNLVQQRIVGQNHLKMVVAPIDNPQQIVDAIAFNVDTAQWPNSDAQAVELVYKLDINEFRGIKSVQLLVDSVEAV
ncbi:MAG: single-stranded-DNA-specific exonuclease [Chitinophagales bacterium]|jgi:single-stranded-DNA-specific exonuclease